MDTNSINVPSLDQDRKSSTVEVEQLALPFSPPNPPRKVRRADRRRRHIQLAAMLEKRQWGRRARFRRLLRSGKFELAEAVFVGQLPLGTALRLAGLIVPRQPRPNGHAVNGVDQKLLEAIAAASPSDRAAILALLS